MINTEAQPAPVQEPVAFFDPVARRLRQNPAFQVGVSVATWHGEVPLYTTPPAAQRQWVGMTDEEIRNFINAPWGDGVTVADFIRAIEAKIKEKNT